MQEDNSLGDSRLRFQLQFCKALEMYLTTWDEFEKAAQSIYLKDPEKTRFTMKYSHSKPELRVKMTDDVSCVQYKTEIAQDIRKVEKLVNNLMRHMTSKP